MNNDIRSEHICTRLRDLLNEEGVKLWLSPYCEDGKCDETKIEELASKYSDTLKLPVAEVQDSLLVLQTRSLTRLREQEEYRASGLCTVRVRISGINSLDEATCSKNLTPTGPQHVSVSVFLSDTGKVLQQNVADKSCIPAYRLKLIAQGRIIDNSAPLHSQGIKNSSQIMAVVLTENPSEVSETASRHKLLEDTRADVMTLVNAQKSSYFELTNQQGNIVELPLAERRALLLAMALHERGKTILSRGDNTLALVLFLEADKEFKKCASELLKSVDNAALLNLDIAWCYLCLRSVEYLPDAQKRLQECQEMLIRTYGPNMERVIALKGTAGNEAVLMMRLHLLQAIVMFHQNKIPHCRRLINQAEEELKRLKVKDEDMCALINLGYTTSEARLGLRAAHGDLALAEVYIQEWQRQKQEAHQKNLERRKLEKERQKLGLCADGQNYVEPSFLRRLEGMGFGREISICALAHTNNVVSQAVEVIQEHPEVLESQMNLRKYRLDPKVLNQMTNMGFDWSLAKRALKKHHGDLVKALEYLVKNPPKPGEEVNGTMDDLDDGSDHESDPEMQACQDQVEAFNRLAPDIDNTDENHLDQTLAAEERFLAEYKSLLESIEGNK